MVSHGVMIVDGQRVHTNQATKFSGKGIAGIDRIPLGYEIKVKGRTKEAEDAWVEEGRMFEPHGRSRS